MQSSGVKQGCKLASLQALKLQATSIPTSAQGFKLQARLNKIKNLQARVQANKPTVRGASNQDKCILRVFHVERYLVRGEAYFISKC